MKAVRIKYWVQETVETGRFELTGLIRKKNVEKVIGFYRQYYEHVTIEDKGEKY